MHTIDELIAYAMGELGSERAGAVERWLASDGKAALAAASLAEVIEAVRARGEPGPSPATLARVMGAMGQGRVGRLVHGAAGLLAGARQVVASALLDTREQVALAGCRGDGDGYQLVLSSEAADIDIQVLSPRGSGAGERWVVLGQIEQEGMEAKGTVFVWRPGEEEVTWETESDEYGIFRLELPAGTFQISVLIGTVAVRLPPLDIG